MSWLIASLIPPLFFALINHIDKHLIENYLKGAGIGALAIISALAGLPAFVFIGFFVPQSLSLPFSYSAIISLNGMIYIFSLIPYFYALDQDEASIVAPLFQMVPIFSFFLGWLMLSETLTSRQLVGSIIIMISTVWLITELDQDKKYKFKIKTLLLMVISSILIAINGLLFKYVAIRTSLWETAFWEYVGFFIAALILLVFVKTYRLQFFQILKLNSFSILKLNALNELLAIVGKTIVHYSTMLAPLSLVFWISEGFQPVFVLLIGILLTNLWPQFGSERINLSNLGQKMSAIGLMTLGTYLIT